MRKLSIAIDGPAGAGKSSVSKILAARLGYAYLDTGAMYRAVTYEVLSKGIFDEIEIVLMINKIDMEVKPDKDAMLVFVDGEDVTPFLRTADVSAHVSGCLPWQASEEPWSRSRESRQKRAELSLMEEI